MLAAFQALLAAHLPYIFEYKIDGRMFYDTLFVKLPLRDNLRNMLIIIHLFLVVV